MIQNRVGIGYDIHQLVKGRKLILGGVEIPSEKGLRGHSDADVLAHAMADALLGAAGEKDIGYHFPNDDMSIEGISSMDILRKVREIVANKGGEIVNIDATLIAEAPKISPYLDSMVDQVASALELKPDQIGIKATTNETLGAMGRGEGMAAMAVASVNMP